MSSTHLSAPLLRTPLFDRHARLGAKFADFAGYEMPIQYTSIMEEHRAVREKAGVFDVSHLGEVRVSGPKAGAFLDHMLPVDLSRLQDGRIQYAHVLNEQGGVMDDILVYRETAEKFCLVVNASNRHKIYRHLAAAAQSGVEVRDDSDKLACIAIQGPLAEQITAKVLGEDLSRFIYYSFSASKRFGGSWFSRTGYTGEDGFEIFTSPDKAAEAWDAVLGEGAGLGLKPAGLGCRNTLRLEAGNPLYGHEFDETVTPFEARLGGIIAWDKEFFGRARLRERYEAGFTKRVCGFKMREKSVARDGYRILKDGREIGRVTSGSFSPSLSANIGLAMVDQDYAKPGSVFEVEIHGRPVAAETVKLPFMPLRHRNKEDRAK